MPKGRLSAILVGYAAGVPGTSVLRSDLKGKADTQPGELRSRDLEPDAGNEDDRH
jgi:hypothetical protein